MKPITLSRIYFGCPCCDMQIKKALDAGYNRKWSDKDNTEVRVCTPCNMQIGENATVLSLVVSKIDSDLPKL